MKLVHFLGVLRIGFTSLIWGEDTLNTDTLNYTAKPSVQCPG